MARPKGSGVIPTADRFWVKVTGGDVGACWPWQGAKDRRGYGRIFLGDARFTAAHRFAYEDLRAEIPDGLQLDHLCMNPSCVNPWHLEPVTQGENTRRWAATVTHCPSGHAYENAADRSRGCKKCDAARARARRAATRYPDASQAPATADGFLGLG